MNGAEMVCDHSLNDSKEAVAASESLNDVIQYYSSSSDDEQAEDRYTICRPSLYQTYNGFHSETTASESSSFGSLVEACSSSESDKKPSKKGDASYVPSFDPYAVRSICVGSSGRKCDASSSFESIVDAYSSSESSTFDTSLIRISARLTYKTAFWESR